MSSRRLNPLWKVLGDLRGIAILAVLGNHAAFLTMFLVLQGGKCLELRPQGRIEPTPGLVGWIGFQELTRFAVPLFLFLAGHYAVHSVHTWKAVWGRSRKLLYPHLAWSFLAWILGWIWIPEFRWGLGEFLLRAATGEALLGYFFTPLILQFYLLSRWIVPWARKRPGLLVLGGLILQLLAMGWNYLALFRGIQGHPLPRIPEWAFPRFAFYFALGAWVGVRTASAKDLLLTRRKALFLLTAMSALLLLTESRMAYRVLLAEGRLPDLPFFFDVLAPWKVTTALWVTGFLLSYLALGLRRLPRIPWAHRLGNRAFQIYLLHAPLLTVLLKLIQGCRFSGIPPFLFFLFFFGAALAGALALDASIRRGGPLLRLPLLGE